MDCLILSFIIFSINLFGIGITAASLDMWKDKQNHSQLHAVLVE